jgi:hypothetical protein
MQSLQRLLRTRPALTLARVGDDLLVNGEKLDTSDFDIVAKSFISFLDSIAVKSMTFLENVAPDEIKAFIGALDDLPEVGLEGSYWASFAKEKRISGILFDQRLYEAKMSTSSLERKQGRKAVLHKVEKRHVPVSEVESDTSFDELLEKMPVHMSDLLLKGDKKRIGSIIRRLFRGYLKGSPERRQKVIDRCRSLMESLNLGLQNQLAKLLVDPLLLVLSQEKDPAVLKDLANLLHGLSTLLLQFVEYSKASRILLHLHRRQQKLLEAGSEQANVLAQILGRPLEPRTQQLLLEDFCSGEPQRQQSAAQLLGSLGHITLPLFGDIIKKEDNPRIRQLAASLLAERGAEAAKPLKRTLVTDSTPEERVRVLDVIDLVTRDLRSELAYLFRDENLQVRDSALRLAERLNNAEVERLLLECIESETGDVAVGAIRCLGRLKRPGSAARLISVLKSTREEPNTIACCHALGQIADPVSIEPLENLLRPKGFLLWKKSYSDEIRASAAFALKEIDDPRVRDVLRRYAQDPDGRVREVALSVLASESHPPENEATEKE